MREAEQISPEPQIFAQSVYTGMLEEDRSEPLRREVEDGVSPDEQDLYDNTPPALLYQKIMKMSAEETLSLVCLSYFWLASCSLKSRQEVFENDNEDYELEQFFKIAD